MHILIAIITALGGLTWALIRLQNSGVDLNSFNPFYWARRRRWAQMHGTKPLHAINNPMEAASVLVVAMAQLEGPLTREYKEAILDIFSSEFSVDKEQASELYTASSHLLTDVMSISSEVKNILAPTMEEFQERHRNSLLGMLKSTSESESEPTDEQVSLLRAVEVEFSQALRNTKQW